MTSSARGPPQAALPDSPTTQSPLTGTRDQFMRCRFHLEITMSVVEAFRNLVMMLLIEPASDRVDELLAELVAQAALHNHQTNTENLMLRCVRWDNPDVYYALDNLLNLYAFQLTTKPGPIKGTVILGIKPLKPPQTPAKDTELAPNVPSAWTVAA